MPKYEIMRWDTVIPKDNTFPYPMIYIKPDKDFLDYIKENNYLFLVSISDTGMQYDSTPVLGMADASGFMPNFRPNFFNDTGYYVIVLFTNWLGYPENNGTVEIKGTKGPDNVGTPSALPFEVPKAMEWYGEKEKEDCNDSMTTVQISLVVLAFLVIFGVLLFLKKKEI